jgi:outer membrane immunogenic protein
MSLFRTLAIATFVAAAPSMVLAADPLAVTISTDQTVPVAETGFDWNGFYAGVYGVSQASPVGGGQYGIGLDVGVNARFEFVLVGAEVAYHGVVGGAGATSYLQGLARLGVAVTDDVVIYGAGGAGIDLGPPAETDALLGGGVELALADQISVRGQYLHGFALTGANPKEQVTLGANFHF